MKDLFNFKSKNFFQRPSSIKRREGAIHNDLPNGMNGILWQKYGVSDIINEDYYISMAGIKYTEYNQIFWPRPTKP